MNEPKSRRELLEAAFDEHEQQEQKQEQARPEETPPEGQEYEHEAAAAKKGEEAPKGRKATESETPPANDQKPPKADQKVGAEADGNRAPPSEDQGGLETSGDQTPIKPPISWKAAEKAHWSKIPRPAQEAIARRELETQQALSKSGQARNFVQEFGRTVMPYAHLIRAQGSTPLAAVDNLMGTAARLMTGDPQTKASVVAEIISNYGVDVGILDQVLVAAQKQGHDPNFNRGSLPPQFAAALKPVYDFMENVNQQRSQYLENLDSQMMEEVERFGANKPYFEELRQEMGDMMEFAASKGRRMTLDQAYERVRALHPELQDQPPGTQNRDQISQAASTLARARRASGSIKGAPSGGGGQQLGPPKNRREALERAWDTLQER